MRCVWWDLIILVLLIFCLEFYIKRVWLSNFNTIKFADAEYINSFSAKLNIVVWDYFHIQYFKYFKKANNRINHKYLFTLGHGLNTSENSEVQAQTPPLK